MKTTFLKNELLHIETEIVEGDVYFHLTLNKWSKELFKYYLNLWVDIQDHFKDLGHNSLYVLIPDDDPKLLKFEMMFGFEILTHCEEGGVYLMYQDI